MITLKYCKKDAMRYVSHIDGMRNQMRAMRRTGLDVKFSQGFNPHMLLNMGVTLPLGCGSTAEYMTMDLDCDPKIALELYNLKSAPTLAASACWLSDRSPNLAGNVVAADYRIRAYCPDKAMVEGIVDLPSFVIDYPSKKDPHGVKDIAPLINAIRVDDDYITVGLAAGNTTVKPDLFAKALVKMGVKVDMNDVVRIRQYVRQNGVLTDADEYLDAFCKESYRV